MQNTAPTWLEIDHDAIADNTRYISGLIKVPLMAVVKANAYGFGSVVVARTVLAAGASWLAVARCNEAVELREAGITAPILILGMVTPEEVDIAIQHHFSLTFYGAEIAELIAQRAAAANETVNVHMKIDTGLGRLGVLAEEAASLASHARSLGGINIEGIFTHLSIVEDDENDPLTNLQMDRLEIAVAGLESIGVKPEWVHSSNSASLISHPRSRYNLVRAGAVLLGINPFYYKAFPSELKRVLTWKTRLISCREMPEGWGIGYVGRYRAKRGEMVGTLALGYGDGFLRLPGNEVLIRGRRVPVIGTECLDMCMVRLDERLPMGEEVVVIGQQGNEAIWIEDLARRWNMTFSSIVSGIAPRVPRISVQGIIN